MNAELSEDDRRRWHAFSTDRSGAQTEPASGAACQWHAFSADRSGAETRSPSYKKTQKKKRETGIEPATPTLARWCSTAEPLAHLSAPLTLITIHHLRTRVKRLSKVFRFVLIFYIVYTD